MKTPNHIEKPKKVISAFLALSLCIFQVTPAGVASVESVDRVDSTGVPILTLEEMVARENKLTKSTTEMVSAHSIFLNPSPLSVGDDQEVDKSDLQDKTKPKLLEELRVEPLQEGWNAVAFDEGEENEVEEILGVAPATKERLWSVAQTGWWGENITFRYLDSEGNLIGTKRVSKAFPVPAAGFEGSETITWYDANGERVNHGDKPVADEALQTNNSVLSVSRENSQTDADTDSQSYEDKLAQLDEILSGIARNGADEETVLAAHDILVELREVIQTIIDNGEEPSEEILEEFHNRIDRLDEILSREPIRMEIDGVTIEVNLSEVMRVIAEEYRRLTGEEGIDYNRLPGVDATDIEGHQTFAEALVFRQVGVTTTISVFEALSAYGNFTFVSDLLKKYGDQVIGGDRDLDGIPEVDFERFRRLVNGTEEAYQEGLAIIEEILAENPVDYPEVDIVSFEDIIQLAEFISAIHSDMKDRIQALIDNLDFEQPFIDLIQAELNRLIQENYQPLVTELVDFLKSHETEVVTIVEDHNIQIPTDPIVNAEDIRTYIDQLDALHADLSLRFQDLADSLSDIEASLMNQIRTILQCDANGCFEYDHATQRSNKVVGAYQAIHTGIYNLFWERDIRFNIDGIGEVVVSLEQLRLLTNGLPNSIQGLLKFPGIAEQITEEMLDALEKRHTQIDRAQVFFEPYSSTPVPDTVSNFGMRIELMALLLKTYGDEVIQNNQVDTDLFRRAILMDDVLEDLFDSVQALIRGAEGRVDEITGDTSQGITSEIYQQLMSLIDDTNAAVVSTMKLALDSVIHEARSLVIDMIQDEFNDLLSTIDNVINNSDVKFTIDGVTYTVDGRRIVGIMREILPSLAIRIGSADYTNNQYERLNGVTADILNLLKTHDEIVWSRSVRFSEYNPHFYRGGDQVSAYQELVFLLVPAVLKKFGASILTAEGEVSLEAVKRELIKDVYLPVPIGESLLDHFKDLLNEILPEGLERLRSLDYSKWEDRLQAEEIMQDVLRQLGDAADPLIRNLSDRERQRLESQANYGVYRDPTWKLSQLTNYLRDQLNRETTVTIAMSDGTRVEVDLREVRNIPGFPFNLNYDQELFVGIQPSDLVDTNKPSYYLLSLNRSNETEIPTRFDNERLIVNLVTRLYENQGDIAEIYRDRMFVDGKVNVEIFRRYLKGVDVLHRQALEMIQSWTDDELSAIEALKKVPMTVESIKALHDAVMAHRTRIMEYLMELTNRHEKEDVLEIEEDVTRIYQAVVDQLINYLRENDLTVQIPAEDGSSDPVYVNVPVQEITELLLSHLEDQFPGEEIGAHHFASFFGVNMEDLRRYNKLEEFLGMQIIALPRNSQFVEIVSKLSEIGMIELIVDVITKYVDEIVVDGAVDVDMFMDILSDPIRAIEMAKEKLDEVGAEAIAELEAIEFPLTAEKFEKIMNIINQAKLNLVNIGNSYVTGFDQDMFDEVQDYVSTLYSELTTIRDEMILRGPIEITAADGTVFYINLSELEDEALERIIELVAVYEDEEDEGIIRPWPPIYWYDAQPVKLASSSMMVEEIEPKVYPIRPPIWYPFPTKFNPKDTPTEAGFRQLLVRLAQKYGSFVVDENGEFSIEKFLEELDRTDEERAEEKFKQMQEEALEELRSRVPENEDDPIDLDDVLSIHEFLDASREKFLKVLNALKGSGYGNYQIINLANTAWRAVMNEYETLLFNRDVNITIDGEVYQVNAKELVEIIQEEYRAGHTDVVDKYKEGGETYWDYSSYKTLSHHYYPPYPWYRGYGKVHGIEKVMEESIQEGPYDFNLGQLNKIPGINAQDLSALDVVSKDKVMLTFNADLREILKGKLNMRVFAPGANVQTVGEVGGAAMMADSAVMVSKGGAYLRIAPWINLSQRDLLYRVVPEMLRDHIAVITNQNNEIDLGRFRDLLRGITHELTPEVANALETFDTNGDREISGEEAIQGLKDFRDAFNALDGDEAYDIRHDYNRDGVIDFTDFATLVELFEIKGPQEILSAYLAFDTDGDFTISADEALDGLHTFVSVFNTIEGDDDFNVLFDFNKDGSVDFGDFSVLAELFQVTGPRQWLRVIAAIDKNNDFLLSRDEAKAGLKAFRDAFNSIDGDENYVTGLDFNEDGLIDEVDYEDFFVPIYEVMGHADLLPDVSDLPWEEEIREVLHEIAFGEGHLVITRITDRNSGQERLEAAIVVDGEVLKQFDVREYSIRRTLENSSYRRYSVKLTTTSDEDVYFTSYEYKNSSRTPRAYYTIYAKDSSETYGDLIKRMTFKLVGRELLQTADTIYAVETRQLSSGRTRDVKRVLQHTYWRYDSDGNLMYENISRRTADGSRLSIRKTIQSDGNVEYRIRVRGKKSSNFTISRPLFFERSSNGLIERVMFKSSNGVSVEIIVGLATITVNETLMSELLEPRIDLYRSPLQIGGPHPLPYVPRSQSEAEFAGR